MLFSEYLLFQTFVSNALLCMLFFIISLCGHRVLKTCHPPLGDLAYELISKLECVPFLNFK